MSTPKEIYKELTARIDRLELDAVKRSFALIDDLKKEVLYRFSVTDWDRHQASQLLNALDRLKQDFEQQYWPMVKGWQEEAFTIGTDVVLGMEPLLGISRRAFEAAQMNGLHFVQDLAADLRREISREILLTSTGLQTPTMAMQNVKDLLQTQEPIGPYAKMRPGYADMHPAAVRAQALVRTEVGRNANLGSYLGMQEIGRQVPGMQKRWLHSGLGTSKFPRPAHVMMSGQSVGIEEYFNFPGGRLLYPQDPMGPPSETINCKCVVVMWHPDWGK